MDVFEGEIEEILWSSAPMFSDFYSRIRAVTIHMIQDAFTHFDKTYFPTDLYKVHDKLSDVCKVKFPLYSHQLYTSPAMSAE